MLEKNPDVQIFCNTSVAELLTKVDIHHVTIEDGQTIDFEGIFITGHGVYHAELHKSLPLMANTGFFIDEKLFYPGDAFINPDKKIDVLALPVS